MATKDWAYRRKAGDGRRDLVRDTVHFLSPPLPLPWALTLSVPSSLPPSARLQKLCKWAAPCPRLGGGMGSKGWGWSSKVWMKEQWVLSGWQVLQRLVTLLLQVTVVVLLGRQRHAVQWVMSMQPLLLFQCQALQLG